MSLKDLVTRKKTARLLLTRDEMAVAKDNAMPSGRHDEKALFDTGKMSEGYYKFISSTKKYGLKDFITKSALFNILYPDRRKIYAPRRPSQFYLERFGRSSGMMYYSCTDGTRLLLKGFYEDEALLKEVQSFIRNYVLTTYGEDLQFNVIRSNEELDVALERLERSGRAIILDFETTGIDPYTSEIVGIGLSTSSAGGVYVPLRHKPHPSGVNITPSGAEEDNDYRQPEIGYVMEKMRPFFKKHKFVGHNLKFEYKIVKVHFGIEMQILHDTLIGEYILDERLKGRYNLGKSVTERFPSIEEWKEDKKFFENIQYFTPAHVGKYCVRDCCYECLLYIKQHAPIMKGLREIYYDVDLPFTVAAAEAELQGFKIDEDYVRKLNAFLKQQIVDIEEKIKTYTGDIDIDSVFQLRKALFVDMKFPIKKTVKTGPSVDKQVMQELLDETGHEIFQLILDRRATKKLESTYTLSFLDQRNPITGFIHPDFLLFTTLTGRISCVNPNFQNLPKNASDLIRKAIVAPEGSVLIFADYSGQEIRVMAAASGDEGLIRAYNPCFKCPNYTEGCQDIPMEARPKDCHPVDIHSLITSKVYPHLLELGVPMEEWKNHPEIKKYRSQCKAVTFTIAYGGSAAGMAFKMGIEIHEAKKIIDDYFEAFPEVRKWIIEIQTEALTNGFVRDLRGRIRRFEFCGQAPSKHGMSPFYMMPYVRDDMSLAGLKKGFWKDVSGELRQAQNFPIQGTAADLTKEGAISLRRKFKENGNIASLVGFVHDEIISCCPDDVTIVKDVISLIREAMIDDLNLITNYNFPKALPMEIEIDVGYNWGEAMSIESYLELKQNAELKEKT